MPQAAAGMRIDPPVSVPSAARAIPVATATADPPLDPPGDRDVSSGCRTTPNAEFSLVVPKANSSRLVLPMITAPASRRRMITGASAAAICPSRTREAAVVGMPLTSMMSLTAIGTPCSSPRSWPDASSRSAASASRFASSAMTRMNALSDGWSWSIRCRQLLVISSAVTSRARGRRANASIVTWCTKKAGRKTRLYVPFLEQCRAGPFGPAFPLIDLEPEMEPELQNPRLVRRRLVEGRQAELRRVAERRRVRTVVGVVEDVEHLRHQIRVATAAKRETLLQTHIHGMDWPANELRAIE